MVIGFVFRAYLSSLNSTGDTRSSRSSLLLEETEDCVAYDAKATLLPKPAVQAFKLLNESPAVQVRDHILSSSWFSKTFEYETLIEIT